jgi:small subunit ribosomal protein S21
MPVEVRIRKGEPMERALRRLKKKLDREGVIRDVRAKRYYEKPSEISRRKKKVAAFSAMLRARYEKPLARSTGIHTFPPRCRSKAPRAFHVRQQRGEETGALSKVTRHSQSTMTIGWVQPSSSELHCSISANFRAKSILQLDGGVRQEAG